MTGFFFQAEDGIRYWSVTGVQTCALPILPGLRPENVNPCSSANPVWRTFTQDASEHSEIGRASCRERVENAVRAGAVKEKKGFDDERGEGGGANRVAGGRQVRCGTDRSGV